MSNDKSVKNTFPLLKATPPIAGTTAKSNGTLYHSDGSRCGSPSSSRARGASRSSVDERNVKGLESREDESVRMDLSELARRPIGDAES